MMKRYMYFYEKNLNRQSDCIVSNPRIFKGEALVKESCKGCSRGHLSSEASKYGKTTKFMQKNLIGDKS
jgi:hypothetical protein